jgi:hypothetical protein
MKQMVRPDVPVLQKMRMQDVKNGFFRDREGKIFFLHAHGRDTFPFPVMEDGTIDNQADLEALRRGTFGGKISLIHPQVLGITEIKWVNEVSPK